MSKRMTPKEAEHILLNITDYIVPDEDYGFLLKSSLVDATLLAIKALRAQSAGRVLPITHAKWIVEFDDKGWKKHSCSGCGYFRRTDIHVSLNWDYCPHCGAKMDLEE